MKQTNLSTINLNEWYSEAEILVFSGFGITREDLDVIKELVVSHQIAEACSEQCYQVSKKVMREISVLLRTDGSNTKKEVLGIIETYTNESEDFQ